MDSAQAVGKGLYVYLLKFTAEYCQHVRCANLSSFIVPADIANIQFSYESLMKWTDWKCYITEIIM